MQLSSYILQQINLITNPDPNIKKYCNSLQNKGHACIYTVKLGASEHFQIKKRPEYCIITVMIKCSKKYSNNINLPKKKKVITHTCFPEALDVRSCSWRASSTLWTAALAFSISARAKALSSSTSFLASSDAYKRI